MGKKGTPILCTPCLCLAFCALYFAPATNACCLGLVIYIFFYNIISEFTTAFEFNLSVIFQIPV